MFGCLLSVAGEFLVEWWSRDLSSHKAAACCHQEMTVDTWCLERQQIVICVKCKGVLVERGDGLPCHCRRLRI